VGRHQTDTHLRIVPAGRAQPPDLTTTVRPAQALPISSDSGRTNKAPSSLCPRFVRRDPDKSGAVASGPLGGAADGFNVMPAVLPSGLELFAEHVVPILQRRGLMRTEYEGTTLREHYGLPRPPLPSAASSGPGTG